MDWFKAKFTGKPHISWENLWFPVDFPLNQSIEIRNHPFFPVFPCFSHIYFCQSIEKNPRQHGPISWGSDRQEVEQKAEAEADGFDRSPV